MTRGADRLLRHFAGNSLESAQDRAGRPIQRQRPMSGASAVYIYRQPLNSAPLETASNWSHSLARELGNATGNRLRPVGSIVRRSPRPVRDTNRTPRRAPPLFSDPPPSPPVDPSFEVRSNAQTTPKRQNSSVPTISIASEGEANRKDVQMQIAPFAENAQTTADELMKLLMEDDGTDRPVIFTIFEAANIDGTQREKITNEGYL
uniref:Uncharacterized protein n=1 Tax=Globodera rostochiensis TaxID=31243 RepID=A0A914H2H1_GLORO